MKKYLWLVIAIILLAAAVTVLLSAEKTGVPVENESEEKTGVLVENGSEEKPAEIARRDGIDFVWKIEELGEDKNFVPTASVGLEVKGKLYELGKFSGNCFIIEESEWELLENELSGVICWWAGGGEEMGLFEENGVLEIRKGIVEEGGEDVGNYRGDFLKVFQVEN